MSTSEIIAYTPQYRQRFIDLNVEWLEKYFKVEPHDLNVFENIESLILADEGEIFFCKWDEEIVGTVAMQKISPGIFELSKMAVTQKYQGRGLSTLLMKECVRFAKARNASKIVLWSNKSLTPAISLYNKFDFVEVPLDSTDYARANIQMELALNQPPHSTSQAS